MGRIDQKAVFGVETKGKASKQLDSICIFILEDDVAHICECAYCLTVILRKTEASAVVADTGETGGQRT